MTAMFVCLSVLFHSKKKLTRLMHLSLLFPFSTPKCGSSNARHNDTNHSSLRTPRSFTFVLNERGKSPFCHGEGSSHKLVEVPVQILHAARLDVAHDRGTRIVYLAENKEKRLDAPNTLTSLPMMQLSTLNSTGETDLLRCL